MFPNSPASHDSAITEAILRLEHATQLATIAKLEAEETERQQKARRFELLCLIHPK